MVDICGGSGGSKGGGGGGTELEYNGEEVNQTFFAAQKSDFNAKDFVNTYASRDPQRTINGALINLKQAEKTPISPVMKQRIKSIVNEIQKQGYKVTVPKMKDIKIVPNKQQAEFMRQLDKQMK